MSIGDPTTAVRALTDMRGVARLGHGSVRAAYEWSKDPSFPRRIVLGPRTVRYFVDEVLTYFASRATGPASEPPQLASPAARAKRAATIAGRRNSPLPEAAPFKASEAVASSIPRRVRGKGASKVVES